MVVYPYCCDTCYKEDCSCICHICNKHQLDEEESKPKRKTRQTEKNINWISCNNCKNWVHPQCTGLTKAEYTKIKNYQVPPTNKKDKSEPFFKCLKCCLHQIFKSTGENVTDIINKNRSKASHPQKETPTSATTLDTTTQTEETETITQVKNQISKEQHHKSNTTENNSDKIDITIISTNLQKQDKENSETSAIISDTKSNQSNINKNKPAEQKQKQLATESTDQANKSTEPKQKQQTTNSKNSSNNICIRVIDNIPQQSKPKSSVDIKQHIQKTIGKEIKIDFIYPLAKGGIAVHLPTEQEANLLQEQAGNIYPNSICRKPSSVTKKKIIIKNISPKYSQEDIQANLSDKYKKSFEVKRFHSRINKKPLPIILIITENSLHVKTADKIQIFGKDYLCETYKKPLVRCYNCQKFGHIARFCRSEQACQTCGTNHQFVNICYKPFYCINCKQPGHPSSSTHCPSYIEKSKLIK